MHLQRSAAVVYQSSEGVSAALKHAGKGQIVEYELPQQEGPVGLKAWVAAHKAARPGNDVLQQQVGDKGPARRDWNAQPGWCWYRLCSTALVCRTHQQICQRPFLQAITNGLHWDTNGKPSGSCPALCMLVCCLHTVKVSCISSNRTPRALS